MALVASQGCDPAPISQLPGVTGLDDPDARVPERAAQDAWRLAASMTGDPALGVHLAESLPRGALDLVEYAFRSSASLGLGLERLARYGRSSATASRRAPRQHGKDFLLVVRDTATIRCTRLVPSSPWPSRCAWRAMRPALISRRYRCASRIASAPDVPNTSGSSAYRYISRAARTR